MRGNMKEQQVPTVYLIGHRNPDTDSICSSIAYASFKAAVDPSSRYVPARLGPLNRETQFVLDYFRVEPPMLLEHVYAEVRDVAFDKPAIVHRMTPMRDTWQIISQTGAKTVNVVDDGGRLVGLVTLGDIAEAYLASAVSTFDARAPVQEIVGALDEKLHAPVHRFMTVDNLVTFQLDDLIDDARETMLRYKYRNFPILDEQGRPVGTLARRHILDYSGKKVILVDHNEKSQSVEGIEQATVLEIIDHHRIATVETDQPIVFLNRPLGCTATIVSDLFDQKGLTPAPQVAGLMCAAILSDTLAFKSPTCTAEDVRAAEKLSALARIDMEEFAKFMFEAGTSLEGRSEKEIFYTDFKEFKVGEFRIGIAQVNIYNTRLGELKAHLIEFMEQERNAKEYDILLLMLTDIINEGSDILVVGNNELVERAFDVDVKGRSFYLPGVISRKKQVIPRLIRAVNAM